MALLTGKVAIVTGAARGIGRAVVLRYAEEGADVAFVVQKADERAVALENEIKALGVRTKSYVANVADFEAVKLLVEQVKSECSRIDILVNNAGITKDGLLMRMKKEDFESVLDINLVGTFNVTRQVIPYMMKQKEGRIINVSSVVVIEPAFVCDEEFVANIKLVFALYLGFTKPTL